MLSPCLWRRSLIRTLIKCGFINSILQCVMVNNCYLNHYKHKIGKNLSRSKMVLTPYSMRVNSPRENTMQACGVSKWNFVLLPSCKRQRMCHLRWFCNNWNSYSNLNNFWFFPWHFTNQSSSQIGKDERLISASNSIIFSAHDSHLDPLLCSVLHLKNNDPIIHSFYRFDFQARLSADNYRMEKGNAFIWYGFYYYLTRWNVNDFNSAIPKCSSVNLKIIWK